MASRRNLSDWYADWRVPKDLSPKISTINNPKDVAERQNLNWLIYSRGPYSGTENVDVWQNYSMNAYVASNNTLFKSNPVEGLEIQRRIFKRYADEQEKTIVAKFGKTGSQIIEDYGIAQGLFKDQDNLIHELNELRNNISAHTNKEKMGTAKAFDVFKKAQEQESKGVAELKVLQNEFQKFSKLLQKVQDFGAKMDATAGDSTLTTLEKGGEEFIEATARQADFDVSRSLKIDKTGYTSAVNLIKIAKQLEEQTAKIDASTGELPKLFSDTEVKLQKVVAMKKKNSGYRQTTRKMNWDKVTGYTVNMITNYFGSAFEVASAVVLKEAMGELLEGVELLGAAKGVTVKAPNGFSFKETTSKTDVRAVLKDGLELNFSNKHQSHSAPGPTKVQDGNLFSLLGAVLDAPEARETLYAGMMNDRFWSSNSSMNQFITALIIDRAVGGVVGNRIDFMLYKDAVIPLSEYLRDLNSAFMQITSKTFQKFTANPDKQNKTIPQNLKGIGIKVLVK